MPRRANQPPNPADGIDEVDEVEALLALIARAAAAGVDLIQLRERDLSARALVRLTEQVLAVLAPTGARLLINDRADLAAACGVGVHLARRSLDVAVVRKTFGDDLLIGASTHSLAEAREAEAGGADFIVFGPVFVTASKKRYGAPVGLAALGEVSRQLQIPVLALGGIKTNNYRSALATGAAGIAAISLFTETADLRELVREVKTGGCC